MASPFQKETSKKQPMKANTALYKQGRAIVSLGRNNFVLFPWKEARTH